MTTAVSTILVVEDDPASSYALIRALRARGYEPLGASAASSAEELLGNDLLSEVRAIVLDLGLPGVGGAELLHSLRAGGRWASVPIVVVTGAAEVSDSVTEAADQVLKKPVEPATVIASIDRLLKERAERA